MSERGTASMTKASRQLDEMAAFCGALDEEDLRKPCLKDDAGSTVGAVAAHMVEIPAYLGQFLWATGYVTGSPTTGDSHSHGPNHRHAGSEVLPDLPDLMGRLSDGKSSISLLAGLTDEQLESVPPAGSGRFADGRRSLERVIDAIIAHQAALLVMLKRAVA